MRSAIVTLALLAAAAPFAHGEKVVAKDFVYALSRFQKCDHKVIPKAAQAAVDAAIAQAMNSCATPEILSVRILSIEPVACRTWTAQYQATAELEFNCAP